jgi:hypothetical protein
MNTLSLIYSLPGRLWLVTYESESLPHARDFHTAFSFNFSSSSLETRSCVRCVHLSLRRPLLIPNGESILSVPVHKRRRSSSYLQQQCFMRHSQPTIRLKCHAIMKYACKPGTIYQSRFASAGGNTGVE